mmetsp:Transcript_9557/g.20353  ORF Transcript_9557/g.20353 Transcript_9557/m.20353 type:complete len:623 (+) Transcript_9557:94-1962(+)|eukprot:CAMPEP_0202893604 /NCGR_PEP_ID=MMETSP1392-20130828/3159_1 /ASSEMBLY_ACC=CAM_ASM_000868 /TAXON_ID=225041 /ORGANISM="Chlamydomonas chlamydogama, Strain SAG 11-48b" /LENGTH=622 /DNA_ID=CAMNT_0049577997 /DNA_START=114 /DNA_END=1982 /DNA_ORIENTATION=+
MQLRSFSSTSVRGHHKGSPTRQVPLAKNRGALKVAAVAAVDAPTKVEMSEVVMWNGDRRIQTQVLPIAADTVSIRSLDWDRDRFDIEFGLENGTTYNSYIIYGDKTALVDASHEKFHDLYLRTLKKQLDAAGRKIDYIIVSHTEPDHSGLIPAVLDMYPDAVVAGSKVCIQFLKGLTHRPFTEMAVKGGDKIDLGQGHLLEFVMAPNLHWPDTMFSYDHGTGIMYTCDAFGMHYCGEDPFDVDVKAIMPHYRFYYDCLMKPNAKSVTTALRKVKDLPYNTIANGHGPILRFNVPELVGDYGKWSAAINKGTTSVAVLYASDYGFSDRLSQTLARGVTKAGVQTEMVDVMSVDPQELVAVVGRSKGVILMSPPSTSTEAKTSIAAMLSAIKPKTKVIVAESYGGKDEPVDTLLSSLVDVGAEVAVEPLRVKDLPQQALYQGFEEAGTDLAQSLTAKEVIAKKKAAMCPDVAKAIARISSGLYVVTAAHNNARSAMIASWVSQASFEPLGLTIAVAKDRAIESLMQVGDSFVLNALGEDNYNDMLKHFLKRFAPGADRFEGVEWFPASNNCPVLQQAIAYMECKVVSRLETPDHWITYCEVVDGKVMDTQTRTAVHRRKIGNYY